MRFFEFILKKFVMDMENEREITSFNIYFYILPAKVVPDFGLIFNFY